MFDPTLLAQQLIQFQSVTPDQAGCLDFIESFLRRLGFSCIRLPFESVDNLYARFGKSEPHFCFAGHVDVVPPGSGWRFPPFEGRIVERILYGRGAVDMKGAIAAFLAAVATELPQKGSLSLLLTSDEEGDARQGTRRVVEWLKAKEEKIDFCLVGEPTNPSYMGEMIKVGRRGSINLDLTVKGIGGHVAYPHEAKNPIPIMNEILHKILSIVWDQGTAEFSPSHLEITSIDTGNSTRNMIPHEILTRLNVRFNTLHRAQDFGDHLKKIAETVSTSIEIFSYEASEAFLSATPEQSLFLQNVIKKICGNVPSLGTSGGTSDARFLKDLCPVIEFGLISKTAHHANECIAVSDLKLLYQIYLEILKTYFEL